MEKQKKKSEKKGAKQMKKTTRKRQLNKQKQQLHHHTTEIINMGGIRFKKIKEEAIEENKIQKTQKITKQNMS